VGLVGFSSISDLESIVNHALVPACVFFRELGIHVLVGLATIANMGAEVGATTSTFPYTSSMQAYLHATRRGPVARAADEAATKGFLSADAGAEYDELIEIVSAHRLSFSTKASLRQQDLSSIEPTINGPFTPDLATPLSKFASFVKENGWQDKISASLIGSCTNSSYEDMVSHWRGCSCDITSSGCPPDASSRFGTAGTSSWIIV
jgi:hypothetical protein